MGYTTEGVPFSDSDTSEAAAKSQSRDKRNGDLAKILHHIGSLGHRGATCDEVEHDLRMLHTTASARINDLVKDGDLVRTLKRRLTRSGRSASVLVVRAFADQETAQ